ncbi:MAG: D-alanine--D-alanine ligase [Clostridia bacterium]|nr:D-alanine--D-alanine ligase [Clostridia bacterium]
MKHVLILFGGVSSEHEVSLRSAAAVIRNVDRTRWDVSALGITKDGRWLLYTGDTEKIEDGSWLSDTACQTPAVLSPDRSVHGITILRESGCENVRVDVVFPVLHGKNGEDGTMQGFLQLAGIPFVGCDALSSAMGMDKAVSNTIADHIGVPQAKWLAVRRAEYAADPDAFRAKCADTLGYPLFVKPANAGSSVGVTKVCAPEELDSAMQIGFAQDDKLVLEEGIDGRELECAVIGNDEPLAPMVGEIVPCNDFYDYEAKYIAEDSEIQIPARVPDEAADTVRALARRIYTALGCTGLSRVDFFLRRRDGKVLFNEINTIPGFTSISMYSKMLMAADMTYGEIVDRLLELAMEKWS